jgi:hypothetical protein
MATKKEEHGTPGKPIKAKLGEESSFYYDAELKRWVNKKDKDSGGEAKKATPPPPRAGPPKTMSAPPGGVPTVASSGGPPSGPPSRAYSPAGAPPARPEMPAASLTEAPVGSRVPPPGGAPPGMMGAAQRAVSGQNSGTATPPTRPATGMSNASSIDDLLGPPVARKRGEAKKKRGGRYVDVMAKSES